MDPLAIEKARLRLSGATRSVESLMHCNEFGRYCELWYNFLIAAKGVYTVLEQGAKASPQSRQWFGGIKNTRRTDDLLQYLYQARDDDEHGLNAVIARDKTIAVVKIPDSEQRLIVKAVYSQEPSSDAGITINAINGLPVLKEDSYPYVRLVRVHGRDKKPYDPPLMHLNKSVADLDPVKVAQLCLAYLGRVIEQA